METMFDQRLRLQVWAPPTARSRPLPQLRSNASRDDLSLASPKRVDQAAPIGLLPSTPERRIASVSDFVLDRTDVRREAVSETDPLEGFPLGTLRGCLEE